MPEVPSSPGEVQLREIEVMVFPVGVRSTIEAGGVTSLVDAVFRVATLERPDTLDTSSEVWMAK